VGDLRAGDVFAGHRITGVAGRGGMGVVYRAVQLDLDRPVALKLIAPLLAEDPSFRERFVRESRLAASIDHPNVIPIYYTGEHEGALYIAMRYVEGNDLRTLVRAAGPLDPERAANIVAQVASALDAAHQRGIVHRDVKPANVLLGAAEHVYLTDFGLTKRIASQSGQTHSGGWVGTLGFVAPEQIRGERVDARADIYALGCLLFHTLAGGPPYHRDSDEATLWAHLHDDPPSLRTSAPDAPPALQAVIDRALAKEPEDRYQSAGDLARAALAAVGREPAPRGERVVARGAAAPADAETAASPDQAPTVLAEPAAPRRGARRPAWVWALAAIPVLALAVVAAIVLPSGGGTPGTTSGAPPTTPTRATTPTGAATPDTSVAGTLAKTVTVGGRPNGVVLSNGLAWVLRARSDRLTTLRAPSGRRAPYHPTVGPLPASAVAAFGRLWVGVQRTSSLVAIGLRSHKPIGAPVALPAGRAKLVSVAAGERGIWVGLRGNPGLVIRVSPSQRRVVKTLTMPDGLQDLAVGSGAVWVLGRRANTVTRIDVSTGRQQIINVGRDPAGVAIGGGAAWVTNSSDDTVTRIDTGSLVTSQIGVGDAPDRIAYGGGAVWVANRNDSTLTRIDPKTRRRVGEPVNVGANPFGLDVSGHGVWVTSPPDGTVQRVEF
jgi:YVTN family beta-propeller protein